ncbi:MAG: cell division protein FtsL [Gammaproteobacteria bacterium]
MFAIIGSLSIAAFLSALEVVSTRYQSRLLVVRLQELQIQRDELEREWGQLLLEQGTWNTHGRIEELARSKLNMTIPDVTELRRIRS